MFEGSIYSIPVLVVLAVIAAAVYGLVSLSRNRRSIPEIDPGIGSVRRLYFYGVAFVALLMAANGVVQIGVFVLDAIFGAEPVSTSDIRLAIGLSLTVVGLPLWAFHWRLISRHASALPVEKRSVLRKGYVYLVLGVSAALALAGAIGVLAFLLRAADFGGYPWAALVVWGGVWAYHWGSEEEEGQPTPETQAVRRLYLYVVAAAVLSMSAIGLGSLVHVILQEAYLSLTLQSVLDPRGAGLWTEPAREALAVLAASALVWVGHWLYFARGDHGSALRQVYVYGFAGFGSLVTVLIGGGLIIYGVLQWLLGVADEKLASEHFRFLAGALASLIVGGGILAYHAAVARVESEAKAPEPGSARSAYPYVLAAVGLAIVALAIGSLVIAALEALEGGGARVVSGRDLWLRPLALSITMGLLGLPLWGYYWTSIRRRVLQGGKEARVEPARRAFIFGALGVGMLALLGGLSFLLFAFFRGLLDGDLADVIGDARGAIAVIVPAVVLLPYHWMVYREDRRVAPDKAARELEARRRKAVTVLVGEGGATFLEELEAALGYGVSPLQWVDADAAPAELSTEGFQELARRIGDAEGANVLLVPQDGGVRVLSYR